MCACAQTLGELPAAYTLGGGGGACMSGPFEYAWARGATRVAPPRRHGLTERRVEELSLAVSVCVRVALACAWVRPRGCHACGGPSIRLCARAYAARCVLSYEYCGEEDSVSCAFDTCSYL